MSSGKGREGYRDELREGWESYVLREERKYVEKLKDRNDINVAM